MAKELTKREDVYGYNPEREIWSYYITKLTNPHFVRTLIGKKVNNALITKISNAGLQAQEIYELTKGICRFQSQSFYFTPSKD